MGEIIYLAERAADRSRPSCGPASFFFALECPLSHLAAERVERALGAIEWAPVIGELGERALPSSLQTGRERVAHERFELAQELAEELELPLVDPHHFPMESRRASRVAVFAAEHGRGRQFALAMGRLAFCGGFDLDDLDVIGEAAAAAGLEPHEAMRVAQEPRFDLPLDATARGLDRRGVHGAPAIRIGGAWFDGEDPLLRLTSWSATEQPPA